MLGFDTEISIVHFVESTAVKMVRDTRRSETPLWRNDDEKTFLSSYVSNEDERTQKYVGTNSDYLHNRIWITRSKTSATMLRTPAFPHTNISEDALPYETLQIKRPLHKNAMIKTENIETRSILVEQLIADVTYIENDT